MHESECAGLNSYYSAKTLYFIRGAFGNLIYPEKVNEQQIFFEVNGSNLSWLGFI